MEFCASHHLDFFPEFRPTRGCCPCPTGSMGLPAFRGSGMLIPEVGMSHLNPGNCVGMISHLIAAAEGSIFPRIADNLHHPL